MYGLRAALLARAIELTQDLRYSHKPTGIDKAPQIIVGSLDAPRPGEHQGEAADYPFVRISLHKGAFHAVRPQPCYVVLYAGIWTPGTIEDGDRDIIELVTALGAIVGNPRFPPFMLSESCPYSIGLQDPGFEGMQRHPFHYGAVFLEFTATNRPQAAT